MPLDPEDYDLSMRLSRRGKWDRISGLRTLMLHRLTPGPKLVFRRPLDPGVHTYGVYCEPCAKWSYEEEVLEVIICAGCGRMYRAETVIYQEVTDD